MMTSNSPARLDASLLATELTSSPRPLPASPRLPEVRLLQYHTDHMVIVTWDTSTGWSAPKIQPYGPISISPSASALHYATQCFEGLKLFRGQDDRLRLFRPIENCKRMRRSAARVTLPDFEAEELEKLIMALCTVEAPRWLPHSQGDGALYVRPVLFGTDGALATIRPRSAVLYIFLTVFPSLSTPILAAPKVAAQLDQMQVQVPNRRVAMKLLASDRHQNRAWPGGFGDCKVGANYGPALPLQDEAKSQDMDQPLWLFGPERYITEAGASNFFVVLRSAAKEKMWQLVTPSLDDGLILPGVTRDSLLKLARDRLRDAVFRTSGVSVEVVERKISMAELIAAHEEEEVVEAFVSGTALGVTPVGSIRCDRRDLQLNFEPVDGVLCSALLRGWLLGIMNGSEVHDWAVEVAES
ncbi:Branched-chain-amino-acid aminotransferase [Teratosphaeria destructans]|uniref:Branched-chain-amino-acid aminotransferase n=1 Tax=Teratosphaeria destructans TaxID=418781 RepID=A0A9W7SIT1_9PEZI|nr:Branched-chain-amino-acid aminotransferase [Teratosphaeria destructans]